MDGNKFMHAIKQPPESYCKTVTIILVIFTFVSEKMVLLINLIMMNNHGLGCLLKLEEKCQSLEPTKLKDFDKLLTNKS